MNQHVIKLVTLVMCLLLSQFGFSGNDKIMNYLNGPAIAVNNSISIADQQHIGVYTPPVTPDVINSYITATLRYEESLLPLFQVGANSIDDEFQLEVTYDIVLTTSTYTSITLTNQKLTIDYNIDGTATYNDISILRYKGYMEADLTITGISFTETGNPSISITDIPEDVYLELASEVERYYPLTPVVAGTVEHDYISTKNELLLTWSYALGAESFDLEWIFVDITEAGATQTSLETLINSSSQTYDWKDATRINTTNNYYPVSLAYPSGIIIYRVRPVGIDLVNGNKDLIIADDWTDLGTSTVVSSAWNGGNGNGYVYLGLDSNKNWTYNVAYAEEGKRKEGISYFDGSAKTRQSVTLLNTDQNAIVAETLYDFEGRPAVGFLPTPVPSEGIGFYDDGTGDPFNGGYSKNNFDTDDHFAAPVGADDMSAFTTSLTNKYYSSNSASSSLYKDYTAHANDFPFSRTTYKRDGTDRITEQTSVGDILQHGTNNTTKYYYGTPADQELERLFGNEVGPASFYQKNMVKDPNGQVNVTYLDKEGRTIATALAGATPDNLLEIDYRPEPVTIVRDLMQNNIVNGDASTTSSVLTIPANSTSVEIYYQLDPKDFVEACLDSFLVPSINPFACTYTLAITVLDEDGADLVAPLLVSIPSPLTNTVSPHISFTIGSLDIGTYTINKTLKVDQQKTQEYLQIYEDSIRKYYDHEDQNCVPFSPPDSVTCDNSCEPFCKEAFREFSHIDQPSGDSIFVYYDAEGNNINPATGTAYLETHYDAFVEQCITECNESEIAPVDMCALKLDIMKTHMSPGGQYFDNLKTKYQDVDPADGLLDLDANGQPMINDGIAPSTFTYDINGWLESTDGVNSTTAPNAIFGYKTGTTEYTWDEIRALWHQEPWATAVPNTDWLDDFVIAYHPEYCAYKYNCIDSVVVYENACYYDDDFPSVPNCTIPRPYISDYDYYMMMGATMAGAEKQKNITGGANPDFMDFLNPLGLLLSATTTTSAGWNADNSTYMDAISMGSASDDPNTNSDFLIDPLFNAGLCNSAQLPLRFIDDGGACVDAHDWILDKLQNFIAIDATPNYHSIWYVMADPDNIASQTSLPTGMEQAVFDLYNTIHGNVNFPARGEGILDKTGGDVTKQNKYQFFRSVYKFYRDYILYQQFKHDPNACGIRDSYTYWDGDVVDGAASIDYTSYNATRDQSYNGEDDLFELLWARNFVYDTYDANPTAVPSSFNTASQATCNDDCENSASIWSAQLDDCIDNWVSLNSLSSQDSLDIIAQLEADLIEICQLGCTLTPPNGSSDGDGVTQLDDAGLTAPSLTSYGSLGTPPSPSTVDATFENLIAYYSSYFQSSCNETVLYPDTIPNPATPSAAAECNCQQLLDYADSLSISPTNYSALATALNNDLSTAYTADDVERWSHFCNNQLGDIIDFPATLECIDCKCDNLAFFITSRYPAYDPYNLTTGVSGEAADVATTLNNEFGTSYDHADITAMMNQCMAGDNDTPFNHVLNANFTDLPDLFRCNATLEITDQEDDCAAELNHDIWFAYMNLWEQELANAIAAFENNYIATCMEDIADTNTRETFTATYELNEYMYTLYYYDQAGNLIKTVPPEGVIPHSTTDAAFYTAIKNHRIDPITYPHKNVEHTLITQYKYDSYNNPVWESTPDGGITNHWYDKLGRQLLSQNAKQAALDNVYSYTLYDALGRIYEAGEIQAASAIDDETEDYSGAFLTWIAAGTKTQVTKTFYDKPINNDVNGYFTNGGQQELRTRVSTITREETDDSDDDTYDYATHFSYDIHGNVKEIFQENNHLHLNTPLNLKHITYEYDLVSGNVNKVNYQPGKADQYYHRYFYDADNRITHAETSRDNFIWDTDAKYFYYEYGPLARTEIGEKQVAGCDYAYTLQGWIKGVNSNTLKATRDIGRDAELLGGLNDLFATDAYGYSLGYFEGDYTAADQTFLATSTSTAFNTASPSLYNGNIRHMVTAMLKEDGTSTPIHGTAYRYDQANRIKKSNVFTHSSIFDENSFVNAVDNGYYQTTHNYDLSGNITELTRNDHDGNLMDDMLYRYANDANGNTQAGGLGYDYADGTFPTINTNQLTQVEDNSMTTLTDFPGTDPDNYLYDNIGQLTKDNKERIDTILWDVYGKVKEIRYYDANDLDRSDILFQYNPSGSRIAKILKTKDGSGNILTADNWEYYYYVRDAAGNIIAVYQQEITHLSGNEYQSTLTLLERNIYGSSRLGTDNQQVVHISKFFATFTTSGGTVAAGTPNYSTSSLAEVNSLATLTVEDQTMTDLDITIQANDADVLLTILDIYTVTSGNLGFTGGGDIYVPANQTVSLEIDGYSFTANTQGKGAYFFPNNSNTLKYSASLPISISIPALQLFNKKQRTIGEKIFEMTSHTSNVLATLSDRKFPVNTGTGTNWISYEPDVLSHSDYYPGHFLKPNRHSNPGLYRYGGANGQESDAEITGSFGSHYTAEHWMFDSRLVRRWENDPVVKSWESPYATFGNNPIVFVDPNGDDWFKNGDNVVWHKGSTYTDKDGIEYTNIGKTYSTTANGVTYTYGNSREVAYITENDVSMPAANYNPAEFGVGEWTPEPDASENIPPYFKGEPYKWNQSDYDMYDNIMDSKSDAMKYAAKEAYKSQSPMTIDNALSYYGVTKYNVMRLEAGVEIGAYAASSAQGGGSQVSPRKFNKNISVASKAVKLNQAQRANVNRFIKKAPANSLKPVIRRLNNNEIEVSITSPGKVHGSKAVYTKVVNSSGKTTNMYKTTYDPQGNVVHIKPK